MLICAFVARMVCIPLSMGFVILVAIGMVSISFLVCMFALVDNRKLLNKES